MNQQLAPLFQGIELSSKLRALALANFEELMSLEFDHADEFIKRGSRQLRDACSDRSIAHETSDLPDALQSMMHVFIGLTRDTILAVTGYQVAKLRLAQIQASEAQKEISAVFNQHLALIQSAEAGENRIGKSTVHSQKLAA